MTEVVVGPAVHVAEGGPKATFAEQECICGTALVAQQDAEQACLRLVPCCCCCRISLFRLPEGVALCCCGFSVIMQFLASFLPAPGFILAMFLRSFSPGIFVTTFLYLILSVPVEMFLVSRWTGQEGSPGKRRLTRFRIVALVLSACVVFLAVLAPLVVVPEAGRLEANIKENFGPSQPASPPLPPLSFTNWMFSVDPPLAFRRDKHERNEEVYLTIKKKEGWEKTCKRPFLEELSLVRYHKMAKSDGDQKLAPIIFHIHGGGWVQGDKECKGEVYLCNQFVGLVDDGFALVSMDYGFACDGFSAWDMLEQITTSFLHVRSKASEWGMDKDRIFIHGDSAGGHLALLFAYTLNTTCGDWQSCGIKAVYTAYPVAAGDVAAVPGEDPDETKLELAGTQERLSEVWPVYHVTSSAPPTMTHHGTWDSLVFFENSVKLHDKLKEVGVKNYLIPLSTMDHSCEMGYYGGCAQLHRFALERFFNLQNL